MNPKRFESERKEEEVSDIMKRLTTQICNLSFDQIPSLYISL